jgi:hypothetical protein
MTYLKLITIILKSPTKPKLLKILVQKLIFQNLWKL